MRSRLETRRRETCRPQLLTSSLFLDHDQVQAKLGEFLKFVQKNHSTFFLTLYKKSDEVMSELASRPVAAPAPEAAAEPKRKKQPAQPKQPAPPIAQEEAVEGPAGEETAVKPPVEPTAASVEGAEGAAAAPQEAAEAASEPAAVPMEEGAGEGEDVTPMLQVGGGSE